MGKIVSSIAVLTHQCGHICKNMKLQLQPSVESPVLYNSVPVGQRLLQQERSQSNLWRSRRIYLLQRRAKKSFLCLRKGLVTHPELSRHLVLELVKNDMWQNEQSNSFLLRTSVLSLKTF